MFYAYLFNKTYMKICKRQEFLHFGPVLGGRWSQLTGGRCSEVDFVLKLLARDLEWSWLTGGCYSEVVVKTGLAVLHKYIWNNSHQSYYISHTNNDLFLHKNMVKKVIIQS